jgi:hypothetical protein
MDEYERAGADSLLTGYCLKASRVANGSTDKTKSMSKHKKARVRKYVE